MTTHLGRYIGLRVYIYIPIRHEKNIFPTVQFIAADDMLDDSIIPMVELISRGSVLEGGTELGGGILEGGTELRGGVLEGGIEFESGIPSRILLYVELGYKS
jgi:hypothetical protein